MQPSEKSTEEFIREITKHQIAMEAYARSLLPGYNDVQDLLQEANITLWKKRADYQPGSHFKAWAFSIIRYHAMNVRRKLQRERKLFLSDEMVELISNSEGESPEIIQERLEALRSCLGKLNSDDFDLIKARYFKKGSLKEFAHCQRKNPSTIRVILRNLRIQLKRCVDSETLKIQTP